MQINWLAYFAEVGVELNGEMINEVLANISSVIYLCLPSCLDGR